MVAPQLRGRHASRKPHAARGRSSSPSDRRSQAIAVATTLGDVPPLARPAKGWRSTRVGAGIGRGSRLADRPQILCRPEWLHGLLLQWEGRLPEARNRFQALHDEAVERGDEQSLPFVLFHLARTELLLGNWAQRANGRPRRVCATTIDSGQQSERPFAARSWPWSKPTSATVERRPREIAAGLELAERFGVRPATIEMLATRGFIDISLGRYEDAERTLDEVAVAARDTGLLEPGLFRYHGDAIEAKIALGRLDEAAAAARRGAGASVCARSSMAAI